MKSLLVQLAEERLPCILGRKYAEVVLSCLTCFDNGNNRFGDSNDLSDEDGILVGVRFIEKVCQYKPAFH